MHTLHQLRSAALALAVFTVLTGLVYPLAVTVVAQVAFPFEANGSLVRDEGGRVIGSRLIGQPFTSPGYFHPRPSAAGDGYDGASSGGSNLGPTSEVLHERIADRAAAYRAENGLAADALVPVDAVTASASGLDPHISVANARLQVARVAGARGLPVVDILRLVDDNTDARFLGILGEPGVNVLELNLTLDRLGPIDSDR